MNVCEPLPPLLRMPVSKLPSLAVAECAVGPLFDQVTVSPTFTVAPLGENLKSLIVTPVEAAARATGLSFCLASWPGSSSRSAGCVGGEPRARPEPPERPPRARAGPEARPGPPERPAASAPRAPARWPVPAPAAAGSAGTVVGGVGGSPEADSGAAIARTTTAR